jgi:hypothetical protein
MQETILKTEEALVEKTILKALTEEHHKETILKTEEVLVEKTI